MRTLKEIWTYANSPKVIIPPSPDQLAVAFAAALMSSGKYADSPEAAIIAAWWAVPAFYTGRAEYQTKIGPMYFHMQSEVTEDHGEEYTVSAGHDVDLSEPARI